MAGCCACQQTFVMPCERYEENGTVCPPNLRGQVFTTADTIDIQHQVPLKKAIVWVTHDLTGVIAWKVYQSVACKLHNAPSAVSKSCKLNVSLVSESTKFRNQSTIDDAVRSWTAREHKQHLLSWKAKSKIKQLKLFCGLLFRPSDRRR